MSFVRCSYSKEVREEDSTLPNEWENEGVEAALERKSTAAISAQYYTQYLSVLLAGSVSRADLSRVNVTSTRTHSLEVDDDTNQEVGRNPTGRRSSSNCRDHPEAAFSYYDNSINNNSGKSSSIGARGRRQLLQSSYCNLPKSRYGTSQERLEAFVTRNEKSSQRGNEGAFFGKSPGLPLAPPLITTPRTSTKSGTHVSDAQITAVDSREEASLVLPQHKFPNLGTPSRSSPTPPLPRTKVVLSSFSTSSSPATSVSVSAQLEEYAHAMRIFNLQKKEQVAQRRLALEEAAREFVLQAPDKAIGDSNMEPVSMIRTASGSSKDATGCRQQGDVTGHANKGSAANGECISHGTSTKVGAPSRYCPRSQSNGCLPLDVVAASHNNNTSSKTEACKESDDGSRASCRVHGGGVADPSATSFPSSFPLSRQHVPVPPKSQNFSSIPLMRNSFEIGVHSGRGTARSPKDHSSFDGVNCSSIYCRSSRQDHAYSPHRQASSVPSSPSRQTNMVRSVEILSPRVRKALMMSTVHGELQTATATTSRNSRTTNRLALTDPKARATGEEQTLSTHNNAVGQGVRTSEGAACDARKLPTLNPAIPAEKEQYLDSLSTTPGTVKHNLRILIAEEEKQKRLKRSKWRRDAVRVHKLKLRIRNPLREQAIDRLAASAQGPPHVRVHESNPKDVLSLTCPTPPKSGSSHNARKSSRILDDTFVHRNEVEGKRCDDDHDGASEISTKRSDEHSKEVNVSLSTTVGVVHEESGSETNEKCNRDLKESSNTVIEQMRGGEEEEEEEEGGQESEQKNSGIYAHMRDGGMAKGATAASNPRNNSDGMGNAEENAEENAGNLEDDNTRPYSGSSSSITYLSKSTSDPTPAVSKGTDTEGSASCDDAENNGDINPKANRQDISDGDSDGEYGNAVNGESSPPSPPRLNTSSQRVSVSEGNYQSYYHEKDGSTNQSDDEMKRRRGSSKDKKCPSLVDASPSETEEAISLEELHGSAAYAV